jgi:hypothetical protein
MPQKPLPTDARNGLRNAQARLQSAKDALKEAGQVAGRASEDLNRASDSLQAFDGLDAEFAKCRIDALRKGSWTGYPPQLAKKRLERLAAQEDATAAQHAYAILKGQEDDARANVSIAGRELEEAAAETFCESVGDVVKMLVEANEKVEFLKRILRGACVPFGSPGWERLRADQRTSIMASAVRGADLPAGTLASWRELDIQATNAVAPRPSNGEVSASDRAYWQAFAEALATNPDADPGPLPGFSK